MEYSLWERLWTCRKIDHTMVGNTASYTLYNQLIWRVEVQRLKLVLPPVPSDCDRAQLTYADLFRKKTECSLHFTWFLPWFPLLSVQCKQIYFLLPPLTTINDILAYPHISLFSFIVLTFTSYLLYITYFLYPLELALSFCSAHLLYAVTILSFISGSLHFFATYRSADKSLARPPSRCTLFDG